MHMFYKLRKNMVRESQAIAELRHFGVLNARIQSTEHGYVLLVPAGKRPAAVLQFLGRHAPNESFDIVGWDDDDGVVDIPEIADWDDSKTEDDNEQ